MPAEFFKTQVTGKFLVEKINPSEEPWPTVLSLEESEKEIARVKLQNLQEQIRILQLLLATVLHHKVITRMNHSQDFTEEIVKVVGQSFLGNLTNDGQDHVVNKQAIEDLLERLTKELQDFLEKPGCFSGKLP